MNSSNLDPMGPWSVGNQMVAFNYQTEDASMFLSHGLFLQNGRCGYVLKPPYMRDPDAIPMTPLQVQIHMVGGSQLPRRLNAAKSEVNIDFCWLIRKCVIIKLHGLDFLLKVLSPYVRVTLCEFEPENPERRTKSVVNNGLNPIWDEVCTI